MIRAFEHQATTADWPSAANTIRDCVPPPLLTTHGRSDDLCAICAKHQGYRRPARDHTVRRRGTMLMQPLPILYAELDADPYPGQT